MANGTCSLAGCDHEGKLTKTWCVTHYNRWVTTGSHDDPRPTKMQRWWAKVDKNGPTPFFPFGLGPCWLWTGRTNTMGYGSFVVSSHKTESGTRKKVRMGAHRWGYLNLIGPIPDGLEPDHLCRNVLCVNPSHLEIVTHKENMSRSTAPCAINAAKLFCLNGHEFTAENTYVQPSRPHTRACRECARIRRAKRRDSRQ